DLVVLDDPRHAFPPYDAVLLISPQAAARPRCVAALRPLVGAIPVDLMREANRRVDLDRQTVRRAAENLLRDCRESRGGPDADSTPTPPPHPGRGPLSQLRRTGPALALEARRCILS